MKSIAALLSIFLIISCASGKEKTYTGSTPAGIVVKTFLGIPLPDSIDFIRWKLVLNDKRYTLHCNYGIGKANTDGFINGGKITELNGDVKREKDSYLLQNGTKTLKLAELNDDLLHLLDTENSLLVGNGGWSYTLNSITPVITDELNIVPQPTVLKDSMGFEGRSPCGVPGVIPAGTECYKLKWYIIMYANMATNEPGTYKVLGTPYHKEGGRTGHWKIVTGKNGRTIYQLNDEKGNIMLYLLKLDEHVLVFTDASGKLLTGDEDFSYTLNRRF